MKKEILIVLIEGQEQLCESLDVIAADRFSPDLTLVSDSAKFQTALNAACEDVGIPCKSAPITPIENVLSDIEKLKVRAYYIPTAYQAAFSFPLRSPEDCKEVFATQVAEILELFTRIYIWVKADPLLRMLYERQHADP